MAKCGCRWELFIWQWKKFLWQGVCYQQLLIKNYATAPVETAISLHFEADFADIFEVRGMKRKVARAAPGA